MNHEPDALDVTNDNVSSDCTLKLIDDTISINSRILYVKPTSIKFLKHLQKDTKADLTVLDKSIHNINIYTKNSITAVHGHYENHLSTFQNATFDYVILDGILQRSMNPSLILESAVNIAKYAIVTIENFGKLKHRIRFLCNGFRGIITNQKWYNTTVIRPCSIMEFVEMCVDLNLVVERAICCDKFGNGYSLYDIKRMPNLFSDLGFFVITNDHSMIASAELI